MVLRFVLRCISSIRSLNSEANNEYVMSSLAKISNFKILMQSSMELEGAEITLNLSPFYSDMSILLTEDLHAFVYLPS